ncbi:MAG: hypothetical protein NTW82_01810 [Bacteroidia bacterium]|nr:hypothetical protein [Bacteroidia bacterium]
MENFRLKSGSLLLMIIGFGTCLLSDVSQDNRIIPSGCTVFTISKGESVFFGGNDDYINPDSYYWVDPGDSTKYGVIWIGTPDNVQQGVNEKGLAYDANGLPRVDINPHTERIPVSGDYSIYPILIMHECSTVEEVISWINNHQWHSYMHDQMQFADSTGDAVIISAGKDGEVVFTRKPSGDGFIVSTNFNVANPVNGYGYPDWRYDKAQELLGQLMNTNEQLTAKDATNVLEAVHMEATTSWTIESLTADLTNGVVYLYYYYQYDHPVILNIKEELSNPREAGPLSKLFPADVQKEASRRYHQAQERARSCRVVGMTWTGIILVSLLLLFSIHNNDKRGLKFWIPAVIILGPLALIIRMILGQKRKSAYWKTALVEATGNLVPVVATYIVALVIIILMMMSGGASGFLKVILEFGFPLVMGWLVFHGPLLAPLSQKNFVHFLFRRLPQVLVVTNLGLAGINAIAMPLINQNLKICPIMPLSVWAVMTWLAITVLGGLAGGFLIFLYERWAVRHNFQAWSVLIGNEGQVNSPSWRALWWWILLSFVVLFIGFVAGVMIPQILAG